MFQRANLRRSPDDIPAPDQRAVAQAGARHARPVRRSVLITGASKGIGAACTERLARAGWHVYAGVRSASDAAALRSTHVTPVTLDVTDGGQVGEAARLIAATEGDAGLCALVNNAGIAVAGPLEFLPLDDLRRQLEVNVTGQLAVTQACLPLLRRARTAGTRREDGRVLFMSSVSGRSALPFIGAYGASKFALEAAADALRVELKPAGIGVVLIEPGVIATPIWDTSSARMRDSMAQLPPEAREHYGRVLDSVDRFSSSSMGGLPADRVARVVERALTARRPRERYMVGATARGRLLLEALPTRLRDWLITQGVRRL
jgi:NAD(P)-dependent dehydrogenase (short-subunit alcohol dehydrogenase family)